MKAEKTAVYVIDCPTPTCPTTRHHSESSICAVKALETSLARKNRANNFNKFHQYLTASPVTPSYYTACFVYCLAQTVISCYLKYFPSNFVINFLFLNSDSITGINIFVSVLNF